VTSAHGGTPGAALEPGAPVAALLVIVLTPVLRRRRAAAGDDADGDATVGVDR
jgi:hypothetical protein